MKKTLQVVGLTALLGMTASVGQAQEAATSAAPAAPQTSGEASAGMASDRISRVQGQTTSYAKARAIEDAATPASARQHLVVNGDTLWDLSTSYLRDPFMWPALWSYNPQITNPHWIYPGDTIYLEPRSAEHAALTNAPEATGAGPTRRASTSPRLVVPGMYLSELPDTRGHLLFSQEEKSMLSLGDNVQVDWVDIDMRKKVVSGQRFAIFSESEPIRDAEGEELAYKLVRLGTLELIDVHEDTLSTARIVSATREIERGDLILEEKGFNQVVTRTANTTSQEGRVIDTINSISQIGEQQYVIINRGTKDGVGVGNRWVAFDQNEGLERLEGPESDTEYTSNDRDDDPRDGKIKRSDERNWVLGRPTRAPEYPERKKLAKTYEGRDYKRSELPLRKIGEVLVIDAKESFSTGIVLNSHKEIPLDTRIVMIKGF